MESSARAQFVFAVCQVGAENALKREVASGSPNLRFAFSRPGFVTWRADGGEMLAESLDLSAVFARTYGFSLGKVRGSDGREMAADLWRQVGGLAVNQLHVWQRDTQLPGSRGFEPGMTPLADEVARLVLEQRMAEQPAVPSLTANKVARPNQLILDCVIVEPNEWWFGYHRACSIAQRWAGGICPVRRGPNMISRAYLKMTEALEWSKLPLEPGDPCVELGSAPGGATQALLERGLNVTGIDPAEMDPRLVDHPRFTHTRKRAVEVRRREFRDTRWLVADSSVAPKHTLDSVEAIVTHSDVNIRGLLLTLKLLDWKLAEEIPQYLRRVQSWGYRYVKARQLSFNRQEICVMALRRRALRRMAGK